MDKALQVGKNIIFVIYLFGVYDNSLMLIVKRRIFQLYSTCNIKPESEGKIKLNTCTVIGISDVKTNERNM